MLHGIQHVPYPENEPVRSYAPGSDQAESLQHVLQEMASETIDIPAIINGEEIRTGNTLDAVMPHNHGHVLGRMHLCGEAEVKQAIESGQQAWKEWSELPWQDRAGVFLKAAELLAGPWRDRTNAATMLGQSKTVYQAEIDAVCELIDFWRFNCHYLNQLYSDQPESAEGIWNLLEYRALEGFVFAITPFNFSSIGANLATAPALMGNVALWKPAPTQTYSAWYSMQLLMEAGLPPGVVNFLPGKGADVGAPALASPQLAGVHFTGSTQTFKHIWKEIGTEIDRYNSYPRVVGETGGKDFVLAHPSADLEALVVALLRGAFEFQGQKCSAASRGFIPASLWDEVVDRLSAEMEKISMGDPADFSHFIGAVIDQPSFNKIKGYIDHARNADDHEILAGGDCDDSEGYFIQPTLVQADRPDAKLMVEEIFGPVLTLHKYDDDELDATVKAIDSATPYALTGAIFARDRRVIHELTRKLRHAAGNFYINDKPTGAVVGQQPFGGGRASGTNDKAGSVLNLIRWVSPRALKETFAPPTDWRYPHMG